MNKVYNQKELKELLNKIKVGMIAVIEHRVKEQHASHIIRKISSSWKWCANYSLANRRRIWIMWDPNYVDFSLIDMQTQFIHGHVMINSLNLKFLFTAIHGLHTVHDRSNMWVKLKILASNAQGLWRLAWLK